MDYSFGLLKPDCLKRGLTKKILGIIQSAGLEVISIKEVRLNQKEVDVIWPSCSKENFYEDLLNFSLSGDSLVFIVKGNNAINKLNEVIGYYEPKRAENGTIRRQFGTSVMKNVIHGVGNEGNFLREALLFFNKLELNKLITK